MDHKSDIFDVDADRANLWLTDPERAAKLAYLDIVGLWHDQVEAGMYGGVPAVHRLPVLVADDGASTQRSRPAQYTRDTSAGQWVVPGEIRRRWLAVA